MKSHIVLFMKSIWFVLLYLLLMACTDNPLPKKADTPENALILGISSINARDSNNYLNLLYMPNGLTKKQRDLYHFYIEVTKKTEFRIDLDQIEHIEYNDEGTEAVIFVLISTSSNQDVKRTKQYRQELVKVGQEWRMVPPF